MMEKKKKFPFPQQKNKNDETRPEDCSYVVLREWWENLKKNKGDRAALRRAATLTEVIFVPAFHTLLNCLRREDYAVSDYSLSKLAAIAGLASRVENDSSKSLGDQLGTPKTGDKKPLLSELRMRRILASDDLEELYTLLRRAISIAGDTSSLSDLSVTIWHWMPINSKNTNDSRRQLALDYYVAAPLNSQD